MGNTHSKKSKGSCRCLTDKKNRRRAAKREMESASPEVVHRVQEDGHPRLQLIKLPEDSVKQEMDAAEQNMNAAKRDVHAAEQKVNAAEQKVNAAEQKVNAAKREVYGAIREVTQLSQEGGDPCLLELAKERLSVAKDGMADAKEGRTAAREGVTAANRILGAAIMLLELEIENQRNDMNSEHFHTVIAKSPSVGARNAYLDMINSKIRNPWACDDKKSLAGVLDEKAACRQDKLRRQVANHYRCKQIVKNDGQTVTLARCCVTEILGDHTQVVAAHLIPRSAPKKFVQLLEMDVNHGIDDYRNLVLLSKNIEAAYDSQRLCFVKDELTGNVIMHILDPQVKDEPIYPGSKEKIGDYRDRPMVFDVDRGPYNRVLSFHAGISHALAKTKGWIPKGEEAPCEYGSPLTNDTIRCLQADYSYSCDSLEMDEDIKQVETESTVLTDTSDRGTHSAKDST